MRILPILTLALCLEAPAIADDAPPGVDDLVEDLRNRDVNKRREAAYQLDQLGARAEAAVPALTRALEDRDRQVWYYSVHALARIGPAAEPAIPTLLRGIGRDSQRSYRSAYALGRIGQAALPALVEALEEQRSDVREYTALAMGWISPLSPAATKALVGRLADDDDDVRARAASALANDAPRSLDALARELTGGESDRRRREATRALGLIETLPEKLAPSLVELLSKTDDAETRQLAIRALRRVDAKAPEIAETIAIALTARLGDDDARVRAELRLTLARLDARLVLPRLLEALTGDGELAIDTAATVLSRFDRARLADAPEAGEALVAALVRVKSDATRASLAGAVGRIGSALVPRLLDAAAKVEIASPEAKGIGAALGAIGPDAVPALMEALANDSPRVRTVAANAIAENGKEAASALEALVEALGDSRANVRAASTRALAALGAEARGAESPLIEASADRDPATRAGAIAALGAIGSPPDRFLPVLTNSLGDELGSIRTQALEAIVGLGASARPAAPAVLRALNDDEPSVRALAARAVGVLGLSSPEAVTGLSNLLSASSNEEAQRAALESLGELGGAATPAVGAIAKLITVARLTDSEDTLAIAAAQALERLAPKIGKKARDTGETKSARERLETALREGHPKLQAAAARAFGALVKDPRISVPVFVSMLDAESDSVRREVMDELGDIGPPAQAAVLPLFDKMTSSRYERRIAFETLDRIGPRDVALLVKGLENSSRYVRSFCAKHLGRMGRDARVAATDLSRALREEYDSRARQEMREALEKIAPKARSKGF